MRNDASNEPVPIPVRLVAGILQGLVVGAGALGVTAAVNGVRKILSKTPAEVALFPKTVLYVIGAGSAVVAVFHALTLKVQQPSPDDRVLANELLNNPSFSHQVEQSIDQWKSTDDPAAKQAIVDNMLIQAKDSALNMIDRQASAAETTKHRDTVATSRAEAAQTELGA